MPLWGVAQRRRRHYREAGASAGFPESVAANAARSSSLSSVVGSRRYYRRQGERARLLVAARGDHQAHRDLRVLDGPVGERGGAHGRAFSPRGPSDRCMSARLLLLESGPVTVSARLGRAAQALPPDHRLVPCPENGEAHRGPRPERVASPAPAVFAHCQGPRGPSRVLSLPTINELAAFFSPTVRWDPNLAGSTPCPLGKGHERRRSSAPSWAQSSGHGAQQRPEVRRRRSRYTRSDGRKARRGRKSGPRSAGEHRARKRGGQR